MATGSFFCNDFTCLIRILILLELMSATDVLDVFVLLISMLETLSLITDGLAESPV